MSVAAAALVAVAVWWWIPAPGLRAVRPRRTTIRRARWVPAAAVVAAAVVACGLVWGGPGLTVALVVALSGGTATLSVARWRHRVVIRARRDAVGQACDGLAAQLGLGQPVAAALRTVAEDSGVLAEPAAVVALGGDPVAVWQRHARTEGQEALGDLARAWQVAVAAGGPMAPALQRMGEQLRRDRDLHRVVESELGSARLTGQLLVGLPVIGLALGAGLGSDPVAFLVGHIVGQVCLVVGVLLACAGLIWTEALARTPGVPR